MEDSLKVFNTCISPLDEQQQTIAREKHIALQGFIYLDTKKMLTEYNINYTKADELILLSISPKDMKRTLELASNMGFIKAFQDKPNRLRQTITNIIKRIAKCEAEGIPYIKSNNEFEDFLFKEVLFAKKMEELNKQYQEQTDTSEGEQQMTIEYLLDVASDLYDDCNINKPKQEIIAEVQAVAKNTDLSPKEVLLKTFGKYTNIDELNSVIDHVLGLSEGARAA